MKRRIRIAAASLMVASGLVGAVAAPASAAKDDPLKPLKPAEALCAAQGGAFGIGDHGFYGCTPSSGEAFSKGQLKAAAAVCEHPLKGTFFPPVFDSEIIPPGTYLCQSPFQPS
jgi:hypothetical protein